MRIKWRTPIVSDLTGSRNSSDGRLKLPRQAQLAGWPTAQATNDRAYCRDAQAALKRQRTDHQQNLQDIAQLAGWPTACQRDYKGATPGGRIRDGKFSTDTLDAVVQLISNAPTGKRGAYQLNPLFSLWLMGYPVEWACCGARAMQSRRKSRRCL